MNVDGKLVKLGRKEVRALCAGRMVFLSAEFDQSDTGWKRVGSATKVRADRRRPRKSIRKAMRRARVAMLRSGEVSTMREAHRVQGGDAASSP